MSSRAFSTFGMRSSTSTYSSGANVISPEQPVSRIVCVPVGGVKVIHDLALVPDVVSGGLDFNAGLEEFLGQGRSDPETSGGVLDIGDGEIDVVFAHQLGEAFTHNVAPWPAKNVANKEYPHRRIPNRRVRISMLTRKLCV